MERLQASNWQAKGGGNPVDHVLEGMEIVDRCIEYGTSERLGHRLAVGNIDIVNVVLREELEDVIRGVERGVASGTVRQDTDPDRGTTGNCLAAAVLSLLLPAETDEVDGGELDLSIVKKSNGLRTNVSPQIATLRVSHEPHDE